MAGKRRSQAQYTDELEDSLKTSNVGSWFERTTAIPFVCSALAVLIYLDTLDLGFCFDDHSAIVSNQDLRPTSPWASIIFNDFWGTPMDVEGSHKSYRPLCVLTFRLNYLLHELNPLGYHAVNVLLHAAVTHLFVVVCRKVFGCTDSVSLVAGALFAMHPVHTEAVAGVVGRAESLSAVFFLLCLLVYKKSCCEGERTNVKYFLLALLLCIATVLCKEQGITVVAVWIVYDVFLARRLNISGCFSLLGSLVKGKFSDHPWISPLLIRVVAIVIFFVVVMVARVKVMAAALPVFVVHDNPAIWAPTPTRQLTWLHLCFVNSWLLLAPSWLCPDWTMQTVPLVQSLYDPRNLATLSVFAVVVVLGLYGITGRSWQHKAVLMGLSLIIFPYIPASNLFFPVGFVVAERILYVPSMGFTLLVAVGVSRLMNYRPIKPVAALGLLLLVVVHSAKTAIRNRDWKSDLTLFTAAVQTNANNGKLYSNLGHQYENAGNFSRAEQLFRRGTEIQPDDVGAHMNLGRALKALGRKQEAEESYRTGIAMLPDFKKIKKARIAPNHINIYYNLANLLREEDTRLAEAEELYTLAIKMKRDFVDAYINRADVFVKLNRSEDAKASYYKALEHDPRNTMALYNLGTLYLKAGDKAEAERFYRHTLSVDPGNELSLHNLGHLLMETRDPQRTQESIALHKRIVDLHPDDPSAMSRLALAYGDAGQDDQALQWLGRVVAMDPTARSPAYNMAVILNRNGKHKEAIPYLQELLKNHPSYIRGYHVMGECMVAQKKYNEGLKFYQKALELKPQDPISLFNIGAVYIELGKYTEAEAIFLSLSKMAPNDPKVKDSLRTAREKMRTSKKN